MCETETIFGLSSGMGMAGVAVIRLSGPASKKVLSSLIGKIPKPRQAVLSKIVDPDEKQIIDEGLVLWFPGPHSFTGEDIVEFQIHGSHAVIAKLLDLLGKFDGLRLARPGEFTRRAFINGRMDLIEVEGLGDLIHAQSEVQRIQARQQAQGIVSKIFQEWRKQIIDILAYLEASIDFIEEEDVSENALADIENKLIHLRNELGFHLSDSVRGEAVRNGIRVVLSGPPNVGKSSILNWLAQRDVAIVSDEAGTTRDVVDVNVILGGIPVVFSDTAGLHDEKTGYVEAEGMKRTRSAAQSANLVLLISSPDVSSESFYLDTKAGIISVYNKSDISAGGKQSVDENMDIVVSAKTGENMPELLEMITQYVNRHFSGSEPAIITRMRQKEAVADCVAHINQAIENINGEIELVTEQVRLATYSLNRLIGNVDVEDLLDVIFNDFCVGK